MKIAGSAVFITGGTSGIGMATAALLVEAGAVVVASGTTQASVDRLTAAHPGIEGVVFDVTSDHDLGRC